MTEAQLAARIARLEQMLRVQAMHGLGQASDVQNSVVAPALEADQIASLMTGRKDTYTYVANATIAHGTNTTTTIQIEADAHFVLQKLVQFSDIALAVQTDSSRVLPLVTLLIQDTGSGRQLMQNPIAIPEMFGHGELPFVLSNPRLFMRNSTIQLTWANYSAATDYNLRLGFIGLKVYPIPGGI
jgi:hypothetical protein